MHRNQQIQVYYIDNQYLELHQADLIKSEHSTKAKVILIRSAY